MPHLPRHRLGRRFLQPGIECGVDLQAVGLQVVITAVGPIDQPFTDVRGKMRSDPNPFRLAFKIETYRPGF